MLTLPKTTWTASATLSEARWTGLVNPDAEEPQGTPWIRRTLRRREPPMESVELCLWPAHTARGRSRCLLRAEGLVSGTMEVTSRSAVVATLNGMRALHLLVLELVRLGYLPVDPAEDRLPVEGCVRSRGASLSWSVQPKVARAELAFGEKRYPSRSPDPLELSDGMILRRPAQRYVDATEPGFGCRHLWSGIRSATKPLPRSAEGRSEAIPLHAGARLWWPRLTSEGWVGAVEVPDCSGNRGTYAASGPIDALVAAACVIVHRDRDPFFECAARSAAVPDFTTPLAVEQVVEIGGRSVQLVLEWPLRPRGPSNTQWNCRISVDGMGEQRIGNVEDHPWSSLELACTVIYRAAVLGDVGRLGLKAQ